MPKCEIVVRQIRSSVGAKPKQRSTLQALGLGRINRSRCLPDNSAVRGMLEKVKHLVQVESGE